MQPAHFAPLQLENYELLDSGAGEKLERVGPITLRRPDPQALWRPELPSSAWQAADLVFVRESDRGGRWESRADAPREARGREAQWVLEHAGARFWIRPTPFKHIGLFPEQAVNWEWIAARATQFGVPRPRLLNLFGYTGLASVLAARAGYDVTHVDASKTSVSWTRENAELSGLAADALRWVVDDALAFARREVRRGARYQAILMDPPHYGRGPKGETWQFEDQIASLLEATRELVAERACVVLSTYAIGVSPLSLANLIQDLGPGVVEAGELVLAPRAPARTLLPAGFCARWSRG